MPTKTRIVKPGATPTTVISEDGETLTVPPDWGLLKPGDAGATRRVKAAGPTWTVKDKRGRRVISLGVWALASTIETVAAGLKAERSTDAYAKKQKSAKLRRDKNQRLYVDEFTSAVYNFLAFHPSHDDLARATSKAVAIHATPVGSGTVARTARIPVEQRAQAAVIAWLRHQTTGYDDMVIPRVKGKRREVRRALAAKSRQLLETYRNGTPVSPAACKLSIALNNSSARDDNGERS